MTAVTTRPRVARLRRQSAVNRPRPGGLFLVVGAEAFAALLGFVALVVQARALGPESFARLEYAAAVAAWLLVAVRGGVDQIVYREAARRPRLIAPFSAHLLGIRLAAACSGYVVLAGIALLSGAWGAAPILIVGTLLFASALTADVGLRATTRLGWLAAAQGVRAVGFLGAVWLRVGKSSDLIAAAWCLIVAEVIGAGATLVPHGRNWGSIKPKFSVRVWRVLIERGAIAGLTRFVRVTLYGLDMLVLGWCIGDELGPYAAARRVVFAMVALGLVVPAVLGPVIARAWAAGTDAARAQVADGIERLLALAVPSTLGLALTADRWMPLLFGPSYHEGGPWLALIVGRLPFLLVASFVQAALVACRREMWALQQVVAMLGLAAVAIPVGVTAAGPWGLAWTILSVEVAGACFGLGMLRRLEIAPSLVRPFGRISAGCVGLICAWLLMRHMPLGVVCTAGAMAYGAVWWALPFATGRGAAE